MHYRYQRAYSGPVEAVIFDWTGTLVDYGARAPVNACIRLFQQQGIELADDEIRAAAPLMFGNSLAPRHHAPYCDDISLAAILNSPRVRENWQRQTGSPATEDDLVRLYQALAPLLIDAMAERTQLIPGALPTLHYLESRGIGVGCNCNYGRDMAADLFGRAAEQGCTPDSIVCVSDVHAGSPWPQMTLKNLLQLDVKHLAACIRVDDSVVGIEEGLNAGVWTVAVALTGSAVGLDMPAWSALKNDRRAGLREQAYSQLNRSGAHYVIDSVADLPQVIEDIEARLEDGERP
ncbi:MAG: phosphonoacetaldehyde hydrolase [Oceanospirillaceae bacterium]|nr:phosphonoacetaldehyde hydrolase [Oceanospirillaceae bacterium]